MFDLLLLPLLQLVFVSTTYFSHSYYELLP
jgi:hypothetical protein